jgi:acyl carrier protein
MAIMQFLILIEEEYGVALPEGELTRQNFSTVRSVAGLIRARAADSMEG